MICCGKRMQIKDSRPYNKTVRRRRFCPICQSRVTTYEIEVEQFIPHSTASALKSGMQEEITNLTNVVAALKRLQHNIRGLEDYANGNTKVVEDGT